MQSSDVLAIELSKVESIDTTYIDGSRMVNRSRDPRYPSPIGRRNALKALVKVVSCIDASHFSLAGQNTE